MKKKRLICTLFCLGIFTLTGCQSIPTESAGASELVSSGMPISSAQKSETNSAPDSGAAVSSQNGQVSLEEQPSVSSNVQATASSQPYTVKLSFAEGTTMAKMFMVLDDKGVTDIDELFAAAESMDISSYPLAAAVAMAEGRCYRLEGYLFPDTYEFYAGDSPQNILKKMLENTEKRIAQKYRDRAAELGFSMDEAIILASLIQKEAGSVAEMKTISSILHNRISAGMRLQLDATITYVENVILPFHEGTRDTYAPTYNTYKCAALPAGPIGNSGLDALEAALWPAETAYYYFAMDSAGTTYYSETYEEHLAVCTEHGIGIHTQE